MTCGPADEKTTSKRHSSRPDRPSNRTWHRDFVNLIVDERPGVSELFASAMDTLVDVKLNSYPDRVTPAEDGVLIAIAASLRSDCTHHRAGAAMLNTAGRLVNTGRSGTPAGRPGCDPEVSEPCGSIHAVENANLYSAPADRDRATLYVSDKPCPECFPRAEGAGVSSVVWPVSDTSTVHGWRLEGLRLDTGSRPFNYLRYSAGPRVSEPFALAATGLMLARSTITGRRVTADEEGVLIAMAAALRADCTRRKVGACMSNAAGRIVNTGRNGAPRGRLGCLSAGACPRGQLTYDQVAPGSTYTAGAGRCIALHAEENACLYSSPSDRLGATLYVSDAPCDDCSLRVAGAGVARIVWPSVDPDAPHGWRIDERLVGPGHVIGGLYS